MPLVGGMRFANVHGQEVGVVFVVFKNLNHVADVAPEGRSSVAAEDEDERFGAGALANVEMAGAIEGDEARIGGVIADAQISAMHVGKGITHHAVGVAWAAGHEAERSEGQQRENREADAEPFEEAFHSDILVWDKPNTRCGAAK